MATPEDYAWAAGLFDGEGSTSIFRSHYDKNGIARLYVRCHIGQKDRRVLDKFLTITGVGHINETTMNGQPFFNYSANAYQDVILLGNVMRFHLSEIKQEQMQRAISGTTIASGATRRKPT